VTVNSDDPAYFGGHLLENFAALEAQLGMSAAQGEALLRNSFVAAFIDDARRRELLQRLDTALGEYPAP
jgi:adenosine deaminase